MLCDVSLSGARYGFSVYSDRDVQNRHRIQELPNVTIDPFGRCEDHGHITTSALVVNEERDHILLTHHAKLGLWLPPGGHCDSDSDVARVCRKEVFEETGYWSLATLMDNIFDIDIHTVPEGRRSREHLHYDVRFVFETNMAQPLLISNESKDLRWVPIRDLGDYTDMPSVLVLAKKLEMI